MDKKLRQKKFVAREILVLVTLSLIVFITYFSVIYYNNEQDKRHGKRIEYFKRVKSGFNIRHDQLYKSHIAKLNNWHMFYNRFDNEYNLSSSSYNSASKVMMEFRSKSDSNIVELWYEEKDDKLKHILKQCDINNAAELQSFIDDNVYSSNDSTNYEEGFKMINDINYHIDEVIKNIRNEIRSYMAVKELDEQMTLYSLIFIFGVYFIRILVWSVKTMRA